MTHPPLSSLVAFGRPVLLSALCEALGGTLDAGLNSVEIDAVAEPEQSRAGCLVPLFSRRALAATLSCPAIVLVDASLAAEVPSGRRWVHDHARWALAAVLDLVALPQAPKRSQFAIIEPGAQLGERVEVGPGAVILSGCVVGDDSSIGPNAVLYGRVWIGERVSIGAGAVVGRPGFGWAWGPQGQVRRMPQLGGVVIEDDVEIGPLSTVDSGTLSPTVLHRGCKLDAQVHVGHNVSIGSGTVVAAQSGFAGSSKIGAQVLVGGQVGVADHVTVGDHARLAAKAGVIGNIAPSMTVAGYPAVDRMRWLRATARNLRGKAK